MKVLVKARRSSRKHRKCALEEGVFSGHTFRTAIDKERLEEDETGFSPFPTSAESRQRKSRISFISTERKSVRLSSAGFLCGSF